MSTPSGIKREYSTVESYVCFECSPFKANTILNRFEEVCGPAVSALGVRSRKLSNGGLLPDG
jgi:hypothetical protein